MYRPCLAFLPYNAQHPVCRGRGPAWSPCGAVSGISQRICLVPGRRAVLLYWPRQVHSVSISKDPSTGLSKGFGFVKYMSKEAADKAKSTLNGTPLKDFPEMKASSHNCPWTGRVKLLVMSHAAR